MKKIFLTSLLAVFAVSGAQAANYFMGGSAGLSMDDTHKNQIMVSPELGWNYNSNWDFGLGVDFAYTYDDGVSVNGVSYDGDKFNYGVHGFTRYKLAEFGGIKLLMKGGIGADFATYSSDNATIDGETSVSLTASVIPMITYDLSESFTLYANLNFMGVYAGYTFENDNLNLKDGWNFGAFADASNVANTSDFQIGFLYNF